ncbi:MAG: SMC-Scp complex subunit ScpB [Candidatus Nanoarchaeia archaeon]
MEIENKADLKAKIESILFCIPEGVTIDLLANKLNLGLKEDIKQILEELKQEWNKKNIKLINEGDVWRFKIPDEHIELIREATIPEFERSVLETLAYIAWRGGARQCDVVRVRSNKAYKHIQILIEKGFIESHKSGLSKWLQPTRKFYEYFKIEPGQRLPLPEDVEKKLAERNNTAK